MLSRTFALLCVTLVVVSTPGCVAKQRYLRARNTLETQDAVIASYEDQLASLREQVAGLEGDKLKMQAELQRALSSEDALQRANEGLSAKYDELFENMGRDLPLGVNVESRFDGVAFQVEGAILFDSGKTSIKEDGKNTLLDIIARIREGSESIRVEGHTDDVRVSKSKDRFPLGNLQLSGERSLQVAQFLIDNGVSAERIYYAGMGPHRPRSDNGTPTGQAENRRVEIVVLFEPEN